MHRIYHYLYLILIGLDIKLGFLTDEKLPIELVYNEEDVSKVRNSGLSQVIIDKLSKVKGKKVRKHVI